MSTPVEEIGSPTWSSADSTMSLVERRKSRAQEDYLTPTTDSTAPAHRNMGTEMQLSAFVRCCECAVLFSISNKCIDCHHEQCDRCL